VGRRVVLGQLQAVGFIYRDLDPVANDEAGLLE
jgi:hypothetical protein